MTDTIDAVTVDEVVDQRQLAEQLLAQAKAQGVDLVGPGGLLNQITKRVLETALEAEMSEHLGYDKHEFVGRDGGNSRNGIRSKTVLTPDRAGADRRPEGHRRILRPADCQEAATPADRGRPDRLVADSKGFDHRGDLRALRRSVRRVDLQRHDLQDHRHGVSLVELVGRFCSNYLAILF